ncbi:hypothetical protein L218DRAFT_1005353 [Marasmius fiardii PR-910]|nr:hypothetical protein L218DRAFT_1005353 [Marasmius fiardii PR-910]
MVSDEGTLEPLFAHTFEQGEEKEAGIIALFNVLKRWQQSLEDGVDPLLIGMGTFSTYKGTLFRNLANGNEHCLLTVPTSLQDTYDAIEALHRDLGHLGKQAVSKAIEERIWVPQKEYLVNRVLSHCNQCQFVKRETPVTQPLHPLPSAHALEIWVFDFVGPLPESSMETRTC